MTTTPAIHFITLGCPKNEVDSDRMSASVGSAGYRVTNDLAEADVAVLNTCAFITDAVEEGISAILELAEWKSGAPGRAIVVAGCLPSRYGDTVVPEFPEVDAFIPVAEEISLTDVIAGLTGAPAGPGDGGAKRTAPGPTAYLQISDGCHRRCAYCTIPSIRGPYRSAPLGDIVAEARFLVEGGARELVLIGQDISAYGRDLSSAEGLSDVLRAIIAIPGEFRVRLMYVQPDGVTDELLETMAASEKICQYLDIPLQHAARDVLRRMHRSGDAEAFLQLIGRIRAALPDVSLRTTMMAGFPGETRADARILETFIQDAAFDYVGVFAFSPEEGTEAGSMEGQVPKRTRLARAQRLRDLADTFGIERAVSRVGTEVTVLFEGVDESGGSIGRTCGQAPEIDGEVVVEDDVPAGETRVVRIIDAAGYDLVGELIR
ncbi:MAG: 30S ribosomal protein S12 methylthiotransferase RimO [Actinobacteria bacterium HGW-Actinobacteria-6]|nr:MAG: 30S ribosomal protein S12 methylthiotransferase RimO [Actinobacteria bacterium HGW-Actinobacteria-6]